MACLHQPDRPIAVAVQVACEIAQELVGILILLIDQRGEVALGVEHGAPCIQWHCVRPVAGRPFGRSLPPNRYTCPYITIASGKSLGPRKAAPNAA